MDIVTDLTAQAISYLTVLQDICKCNLPERSVETGNDELNTQVENKLININKWGTINSDDLSRLTFTPKLGTRISEIIWHSCNSNNSPLLKVAFFKIAANLLRWIFNNSENIISKDQPDNPIIFKSPFFWRQQIRDILYRDPEQRLELIEKLEYLPLQVVFAIRKKGSGVYDQRLYQVYKPFFMDLLSEDDRAKSELWHNQLKEPAQKRELESLVKNDQVLLSKLIEKEISLPFETLFGRELNEIKGSREKRNTDIPFINTTNDVDTANGVVNVKDPSDLNDPLKIAKDMKLRGLAFSGGGIRSATFNLGILQKLASLNLLGHFDYLSTVSGGGYIGTWYTSWLMRSSSISKVTARLCPNKSGDPLADEVRPIRWLRMFSNYLSPNAGIMSPDAWTAGITWLRNAIINQIILLLILLTALSAISTVNRIWIYLAAAPTDFSPWKVFWWSLITILPGSLLAGKGMQSFNKDQEQKTNVRYIYLRKSLFLVRKRLREFFKEKLQPYLSHLLIGWGVICSLLVTTWFYSAIPDTRGLNVKFNLLILPCSVSGFIGMLIIAFLGNYHQRHDLKQVGRAGWISKNKSKSKQLKSKIAKSQKLDEEHDIETVIAIIISSAISAFAGVCFIVLAWQLMEFAYYTSYSSLNISRPNIVLVIGVPLILEAISLIVVSRMALMGKLFPDERREWWGKMGGVVHRSILIWILVSSASLIIPDVFQSKYFKDISGKVPMLLGGWAAIITCAVRLAFSSKQMTSKDVQGSKFYIEVFIKIAPYIFMLGFLLIGAYTVEAIRKVCDLQQTFDTLHGSRLCLLITVLLALITCALSWRVGVNEFSLHYFYRNRLIRAYMGATRRRSDREETANSFTDFDTNDDILLASMRSANGYIGPYPIINTALNATVVSALDRQDRKAESFMFSPLFCGYDFSPTRSAASNRNPVYEYGYRPTENFSDENGGPTLGTAMAISGAAVNPNFGYHSSAPIAFLLTVFNVRLGWWIGNPRLKKWKRSDPETGLAYLIKDLIGKSDINTDYVCLSDGGHFDNMGLYELIRRRCNYILLGDGEQDDNASCEGLANAIRRCRIDFGVEIDLDITKITKKDKDTGYCNAHIASGTITYPGSKQSPGTIIYVKTALTGDEPVDIREYAIANPEFPQQSTGDQFFDEAQFESYRKLGYHSINSLQDLKMQ
jgi:hypothetical protein